MRYGILVLVVAHGSLLFLLSAFHLRTTRIYVLCCLFSQSLLAATEVFEYTSVPWRRGILDVSRGTRSKAASVEKNSSPQHESGSGDMKMADFFRMVNERFDEQDNTLNSCLEELHEDVKNNKQRFKVLQFRVLQPRLEDMNTHEGKSGELDEIATEAGVRRTTSPKPQRQ